MPGRYIHKHLPHPFWHIIRNTSENYFMNNESLKPREPQQLVQEFETDSQKIVRRHLENENDVITDEDIRSIRIGLSPQDVGSAQQQLEEILNDVESEPETSRDNDADATDEPITPWDTLR
jgi:hypothetical protein